MFFIRRCIGFGAALGCHLVFTHPTAMDGNFRSETIYAVTRLAWLGVGYGERGWFGGTLLCVNCSKWQVVVLFEAGEIFSSWKLRKSRKPNRCFKLVFFNLRQENKSWLVILGTSVFLHHVFRDMLIYFSTRLVFFRDWEFSRWIQAFFFQNLYTIRFSQVFQFECTHFFGNMSYHSDERAFHNSLVASHHPWCRAARFHQFVFLTHLRLKPWISTRLCWCQACNEAVVPGKLFTYWQWTLSFTVWWINHVDRLTCSRCDTLRNHILKQRKR